MVKGRDIHCIFQLGFLSIFRSVYHISHNCATSLGKFVLVNPICKFNVMRIRIKRLNQFDEPVLLRNVTKLSQLSQSRYPSDELRLGRMKMMVQCAKKCKWIYSHWSSMHSCYIQRMIGAWYRYNPWINFCDVRLNTRSMTCNYCCVIKCLSSTVLNVKCPFPIVYESL